MEEKEILRLQELFADSNIQQLKLKSNDNEAEIVMDILEKNQKKPAYTSIIEIPKGESLNPGILEKLESIQLLDSYISVLAAYLMYEDRKTYDITKPKGASDFIQNLVNYNVKVLVRHISHIVKLERPDRFFHKEKTTNTNFHSDLLKTLFRELDFNAATLKQLHEILTNISGKLKDGANISEDGSTATLDHLVKYYYFVNVKEIDRINVKLQIFHINIDKNTYKLAIRDKISDEHFEFKMNYIYQKAEIRYGRRWESHTKDFIQNHISELTGQEFEAVKKITNIKVIRQGNEHEY